MTTVFEQIVAAVHEQLAEPSLPYGVFRLSQQQNTAVRRVIWIPTSFESQVASPTNPRPAASGQRVAIGQEAWSVECHITGSTLEDAETLRERIQYAVRRVMHTSSRPAGGVWVNQDETEAATMYGSVQKVIQRFTWTVNVLEPAEQSVVVEAIDTTPAVDPV